MNTFASVHISNWRQFRNVNIDLSSQTTVLTGPNGCGKTTLLKILSQHFGWSLSFTATAFVSEKRRKKYYSDLKRREEEELAEEIGLRVGEVRYSNDQICILNIPGIESEAAKYNLQYQNQGAVPGLFIPSHQPALIFEKIDSIPIDPKGSQQQYQEYQQFLLQTYGGTHVRNPGGILKTSLISMALFGYGNAAVLPNPELRLLFEAFQRILKILLPPSIGFQRLEVRNPDIVLVTESSDFPLDSMSGGVQALFSIAWQIHMYAANSDECTVVIDEPENHLHPSMQRTLLPNLSRAFPRVRFIAATHSPFIVTSDEQARVYALLPDSAGRIDSQELTDANLAASPEEVLRDILDVQSTLPVWVIERIAGVFAQHSNLPDGEEKATAIYDSLQRIGILDSVSSYTGDEGSIE
ncbi:AAA family ATPase [Botrimarina mediterranea]|uniref:AAA family ATPase n=1 Tax=Botrimarina mediterranea TaxID=2528022 RepID=UPI00118BB577|nr:recombination protein F [Planctomycetes bacterium K2D]